MRRVASTLVIALMSFLLAPAASIASHQGGGGPRDFAVGGGSNSNELGGSTHLAFAAHRGAPGFSGLVPAGDDLLSFQGFEDAAQAVAQVDQSGEGATGDVRAKGDLDGDGPLSPFKLEGPVTCLTVVGNRASIFYEFRHAEPSFLEGGGIQIFIEDNGPPVNGQSVDGSAFLPPIPGPPPGAPPFEGPTVCPPPPTEGYDQNDSGNFLVHDAP
jgi:hypothetical protein